MFRLTFLYKFIVLSFFISIFSGLSRNSVLKVVVKISMNFLKSFQ